MKSAVGTKGLLGRTLVILVEMRQGEAKDIHIDNLRDGLKSHLIAGGQVGRKASEYAGIVDETGHGGQAVNGISEFIKTLDQ
ncbi:unnamed protein product [Dibothriocephalus latus]|uniref:Uncharacterized protein n=1 Tax=Dibothriocephalus latus TaxID=60516 RepID=A0A3P7LXT2_DIBLA|nr:unnamed protein product [Dibothriocephalus latus]